MLDLHFYQIAKKFPPWRELPAWLKQGIPWGKQIYMLRHALGMTQKQLSKRIQTRQANIPRLEKEEVDPRLSTLRRVAEALNCELMIRLVPKKDMEKYVKERAGDKAKALLSQSVATANLEVQKPSSSAIRAQLSKLTEKLLIQRRKIWED